MSRGEPTIPVTLAEALGETTHISGLLQKVRQAWPGGLEFEAWLEELAFQRGAWAYPSSTANRIHAEAPQLANEEIGICLLLGSLSYNPMHIRMAAQLLTSADIDPAKLVWLARLERCERILAHIARACQKVELEEPIWKQVAQAFEQTLPYPEGLLPHWSRFAFQTGMDHTGQPRTWWLRARRPHERPAHPAKA